MPRKVKRYKLGEGLAYLKKKFDQISNTFHTIKDIFVNTVYLNKK